MGLMDLIGRSRPPRERMEPVLDLPATPQASLNNPAVNLADADGTWMSEWATGLLGPSFGPVINERTAMTVSAVYRSVTLRGGVVAGLPLKIYERTPEGRREAPQHRLSRLLKVAPFPGRVMTAFVWLEQLMAAVDLYGNAFAAIRYDNAGRIIALEPFAPWHVTVRRRLGRSLYICTHEDGALEVIDQEDMLHVVGPNLDPVGVRGISRIQGFGRDPIALAKVLEEQTGRVHENAARPSGVMTVPPGVSADGLKRLKAQFGASAIGRDNAGRVIFVDKDSTFTPIQISPVDLATIESRRYQVAEVARIFGVPLHLLQETDKSTSWGSGLAEQNLAWLCYSLNADLSRIEAELNYKLLDGTPYYVEFQRGALLEMDPAKSAEVAQKEISFGGLTVNEYRRMQNRPPVEGGDTPLVNSTNVPLAQQLAAPQPPGASNAP
jgi:HK97 family phage portal protein